MDTVTKLLPLEKTYRIRFAEAKDIGELAHAFGDGFPGRLEILREEALRTWVRKSIPTIGSLSNEPVRWLIDGIFPYGCLSFVAGQQGSYKSIMALFAASAIECGTQFLGRKVLRPIPVLYIDRENPECTVSERRRRMDVPGDVILYWGDWHSEPTPGPEDLRLREFALREKGFIVFDSLQQWLDGADENDNAAMTALLWKFRQLARLGAGVLLLHHTDKYGKAAWRGCTAITSGADMSFGVSKTEDGLLEVREIRFRMSPSYEIDVRLHFGVEQYTYSVERDQRAEQKRHTDQENVQGLIQAVIDERTEGVNQTQLCNLLEPQGINRKKAIAILRAGMAQGLWRVEPSGKNNGILYFPSAKPENHGNGRTGHVDTNPF